jgi:hypothetical protein
MSITIVTPSHYTLMSERPAAVQERHREAMTPASVVASGPGMASSSCVVTISPSTASDSASRRTGHPPQLPSGDPCLIVMRPRVQRKPPRKAGTGTGTGTVLDSSPAGGPLTGLSAGRG